MNLLKKYPFLKCWQGSITFMGLAVLLLSFFLTTKGLTLTCTPPPTQGNVYCWDGATLKSSSCPTPPTTPICTCDNSQSYGCGNGCGAVNKQASYNTVPVGTITTQLQIFRWHCERSGYNTSGRCGYVIRTYSNLPRHRCYERQYIRNIFKSSCKTDSASPPCYIGACGGGRLENWGGAPCRCFNVACEQNSN